MPIAIKNDAETTRNLSIKLRRIGKAKRTTPLAAMVVSQVWCPSPRLRSLMKKFEQIFSTLVR